MTQLEEGKACIHQVLALHPACVLEEVDLN